MFDFCLDFYGNCKSYNGDKKKRKVFCFWHPCTSQNANPYEIALLLQVSHHISGTDRTYSSLVVK